jgi:hypothetical protein
MFDRLRRRPAAIVVAATVGVLAGACGSGGSGAETPTSVTPLETTASSGAAGTAAITPPGTELDYGQPAFVPIQFEGRSGALSVSVLRVTAGLPQDAVALQLTSGTPYYVTMTIQNTGAPPDLGSYEPELYAIQDDGTQALGVSEPDDFPPCLDHGPEKLALGASFTTCEAYVATEGHVVKSVQYIDDTNTEPITWH